MITKLLHTRYRVTDLEKTIHFYRDVLGLEIAERVTSGRGSELVYFKVPGGHEQIEICKYEGSGPVVVGYDLTHLGFEVASIEAVADRAKAHGYELSDGPHLASDGFRFAFIDAPEGYEVELLEPPKAA